MLAKGRTAIEVLPGTTIAVGALRGGARASCQGAIAEQVVSLDDHIAEIDADAKLEAPVSGNGGVPVRHPPLHGKRALYRGHDARELDQQSVTGGLHHAAAMLGQPWENELGKVS